MADLDSDAISFPAFDDLPSVDGQPQGCLWGFFDTDGKKDELGTLNLLTPAVVRAACAEIVHGVHVQLDWSLSNLTHPATGRFPLEHTIKDLSSHGYVAFDDEIRLNTQTSSQWDSLKHFGLQKQELFYNGLTLEEARTTSRNGIHNMCERGGIVGRAILVDWLRWWEHTTPAKTAPSPVTTYRIPISDIEQVLSFQGTVPRQGDIFILRTGYVRWHDNADAEARSCGTGRNNDAIGLASDMDTVRWLYSRHFAAVAGDALGFEAWPYPSDCCLHEWLLGQWGTPIGELWDLEVLSETCERLNRWSFFFTSAPLHIHGGVASPPCAIAIF